MGCGFRAVAAEGHVAPSPGVGLCLVEEEQDAGLALAGSDQAEVLVADQVGDRLRDRLQELPGRRPSPDPLQTKGPLVGGRLSRWAATGLDESVCTGEGLLGGRRVAVAVSEFGFLGGSIGVAAAERLTVAVERATVERLPLIAAPLALLIRAKIDP